MTMMMIPMAMAMIITTVIACAKRQDRKEAPNARRNIKELKCGLVALLSEEAAF